MLRAGFGEEPDWMEKITACDMICLFMLYQGHYHFNRMRLKMSPLSGQLDIFIWACDFSLCFYALHQQRVGSKNKRVKCFEKAEKTIIKSNFMSVGYSSNKI